MAVNDTHIQRMPSVGTVAASKLPTREKDICLRVKAAREALGFSQDRFAAEIGLPKSSLGSYELCRTPLRADLALRICRQFIISEEWLATGRFDAIHASAPEYQLNTKAGFADLAPVFMFQCLDLASEPVARHLPPGVLFSTAYDQQLASIYAELAKKFRLGPRIVFTDYDTPVLALNLLRVYQERWFRLLANEAHRRHASAWAIQRQFLRALIEEGAAVFREAISS